MDVLNEVKRSAYETAARTRWVTTQRVGTRGIRQKKPRVSGVSL